MAADGFGGKMLGCWLVPLGREEEIDGMASLVHRAIQRVIYGYRRRMMPPARKRCEPSYAAVSAWSASDPSSQTIEIQSAAAIATCCT
jgi:hypothetical protein